MQGPEVAAGTALKQIQYIGEEGGGGGGGRAPGIACEAHIQGGRVLGRPSEFFWNLDHLKLDFLVESHC